MWWFPSVALAAVPPTFEAPVDVPVVDQSLGDPYRPGMMQTGTVALDAARGVALGLREGTDAVIHNVSAATGVGLGLDYAVAFFVTAPVVLSHEEWHLAALREGGVTGRDAFWSGTVDRVADRELVAMKADDPAGLVRAHSAGLELQSWAVRTLSDEGLTHAGTTFVKVGPFENSRSFVAPHLQAMELNSFNYYAFCASEKTDGMVEFVEGVEGGPQDRDFTGPDCTGWARDLLRPDEAYTARGPHGSGTGLGRYVGWSDLTPEERQLLQLQLQLHFLDLANPRLYGIDRIHVGRHAATASLQHWLTPCGYAIDVHGGARGNGAAVFGTVRLGRSDDAWYPAVEARVTQLGVGPHASLDVGAEAWLQPEGQRWGAAATPGGAVSARVGWVATQRLAPFLSLTAKSAGWTPGIAAMDPAVQLAFGARLQAGHPRAAL